VKNLPEFEVEDTDKTDPTDKTESNDPFVRHVRSSAVFQGLHCACLKLVNFSVNAG
jgi:hypothetical protein